QNGAIIYHFSSLCHRFLSELGSWKRKKKKTSGKIWKLCFKNLRLTSHSFVIVTEQSWCK
ncbi:hypothetical protein, partial [uncultured Bacteroides sp.]|uniref:hypothetical protein n=1 Tax=uncultured Bacteroides sp. TaxID=162156 RepID=UPI0025A622F3